MAATSPGVLLDEARCFGCYGASITDLLKLALWDRISQNISGGDPDVESFVTRSGITDAAQIAAVETLVVSAKANGWWDKCDLIYPFVGGTAQAHAQNLKSSNFTITWNGTVTHNANGITGDGATGYGDTGYTPSSSGQWALNSAHIGIYRRVVGATANRHYCSAVGAGVVTQFQRGLGTGVTILINDATSASIAAAALAWAVLSRIDAAGRHLFVGGVDNSSAAVSTTITTMPFFILALNNNGVASGFSNGNLAGATVGSGITFAEYGMMTTDWQAFNTALGRQV